MEINKDIFRSYDIRGIYEEELTNELAFQVGMAFGSISDKTVIVGHDARSSSNALNTNLIKGLIETGVNVIDIGLVTTPMLYYARELYNKPYAIMITASHCAKEYNGFKLCDKEGAMYGEKIKDFLNIVLKGNFKKGIGNVEFKDITFDYKKMILDKIVLGKRKIKAVVDCGNGTTSYYNPDILKDLGVDVIPLYCNLDPTFPNHIPDPAVDKNMEDLRKAVINENADLGIAFDGDGDRIGVVDEKGNLIRTDMFMIIIWKSIYKTCKNKTASFDVKCSKALKEELEKLGLKTKYNKTGHSYLKKAVKDNNYDFAGEFSGHVCFNDDFYGFDDALYAACRLLKILSNSNFSISKYLDDVPKYVSSSESYIKVLESKKDLIVNKVLKYAKEKKYKVTKVDGVRIEYDDGFALVRKSNTSACITVRFEGKTLAEMESHRLEILKIINEEI